MSMNYIRDTYKVPAKRGTRVIACGKLGKIIGSRGGYLRIKIDTEKKPLLFHPTWNVVYLTSDGKQK
jgi:hypothetical protein